MAAAAVQVSLSQPVAAHLDAAAQVLGELVGAPLARADPPDGFGAEPRRVRRMALGHVDSYKAVGTHRR